MGRPPKSPSFDSKDYCVWPTVKGRAAFKIRPTFQLQRDVRGVSEVLFMEDQHAYGLETVGVKSKLILVSLSRLPDTLGVDHTESDAATATPRAVASLRRQSLYAIQNDGSQEHRAAEHPDAWDHVRQCRPCQRIHEGWNQLSCAVRPLFVTKV